MYHEHETTTDTSYRSELALATTQNVDRSDHSATRGSRPKRTKTKFRPVRVAFCPPRFTNPPLSIKFEQFQCVWLFVGQQRGSNVGDLHGTLHAIVIGKLGYVHRKYNSRNIFPWKAIQMENQTDRIIRKTIKITRTV